jgi:AraC-like DNA-binding protein
MTSENTIPLHRWNSKPNTVVGFKIERWGGKRQDLETLHPHCHEYYEIMCFLSGTFVHDIDFRSHESTGADFHFVGAHNVHMMVREQYATGISIMFTPDFVPAELMTSLPFNKVVPILKPDLNNFKDAEKLLEMMLNEYQQQDDHYTDLLHYVFAAFLYKLIRFKNELQEESVTTSKIVIDFEKLVNQHAVQWKTVDRFAEELNISSKHLIAQVKAQTGFTPLHFIHDQQLTQAKRMLYFTKTPVKEIAFTLGFNDSTNFTKWFKNKTGYTPQKYRVDSGK